MDSEKDYAPEYLKGIAYFNECEFFEAHEVWEELWTEYRGESREFYKGLIQLAVALHHFCNENIRGARKVFLTSRAYLDKYRPLHEGIDLDKLIAAADECFREVVETKEEFPSLEIDASLIPEIEVRE